VNKSIDVSAPLTIKPGVLVKFSASEPNKASGRLVIKNEFTALKEQLRKKLFLLQLAMTKTGETLMATGLRPSRIDPTGEALLLILAVI